MSTEQQRVRYQQALALWIEAEVIGPVIQAHDEHQRGGSQDAWKKAIEAVHTAIRAKVLESYRNGQKTSTRGKP
jgi:hypothetical protein